jgi:hypothetical protein
LQFLCHLQVSLLEPSKTADPNAAATQPTGHKAAVGGGDAHTGGRGGGGAIAAGSCGNATSVAVPYYASVHILHRQSVVQALRSGSPPCQGARGL